MVRLISDEHIGCALKFCSCDPIGVRVAGYLSAYRTDYDFALFWLQEKDGTITSVISRIDGNMTVCSNENADFDELSEFMKVVGYETVFSYTFVLEKLKLEFAHGDILKLEKFEKPKIQAENIIDPKSLYNLGVLSGGAYKKENYLPWLSDFTFRQKRNMLHAMGIYDEKKLVSCVATSAESETDAIISAVATDENYRNRGLAKSCVLTLANDLKSTGKSNIYVMTKSVVLSNYYERLGFVKIGEWGEFRF